MKVGDNLINALALAANEISHVSFERCMYFIGGIVGDGLIASDVAGDVDDELPFLRLALFQPPLHSRVVIAA